MMSVSILLLPLAISAVAKYHASTSSPSEDAVIQVSTRMRDVGLLQNALEDTGAVVERRGNSLSALWAGVRAEFERNDFDIWTAELSGDVDQERAVGIVQAVDQAYGRQVQAAVLQRIAERAGSAGMTVDSTSKNADESITVVLSVDRVMA